MDILRTHEQSLSDTDRDDDVQNRKSFDEHISRYLNTKAEQLVSIWSNSVCSYMTNLPKVLVESLLD